MKIHEFVSKLNELNPENVRDYNSQNGWGFGGADGKMYHYKNDNVRVLVATARYRHLPSCKFIRVDYNGKTIADVDDNVKSRERVIEKLISIGV